MPSKLALAFESNEFPCLQHYSIEQRCDSASLQTPCKQEAIDAANAHPATWADSSPMLTLIERKSGTKPKRLNTASTAPMKVQK